MKKRFLSILLAVLMVITVFPITVFANGTPPEDAVAYVTDAENQPIDAGEPGADGENDLGGGYYKTLEAAIAADLAASKIDGYAGSTITMLKNDKLVGNENTNAGWEIKNGQNIVLDLNGYKLCLYVTASCVSKVIEINSGATLTLEDNSVAQTGLVYNSITDDVQVGEWWLVDPVTGVRTGNYETTIIHVDGTFVMNSGRLQNNGIGSICYAFCSHQGSTTEIHGGKIDGTHGGSTARLYHSSNGDINFTMDGGSIGTKEKPAFVGISSQLSNATCTGTYTISGGEFIGDGWWYWNEEAKEREYGFGIYSSSGSGSNINWNISGGSFENFAIALYPACGEKVNISGGRFNKLADSSYGLIYNCEGGITGGYFSEDVSTQVKEGLYCVKNTHTTDQFSDDGEGVDVTAATTGLKFTIGNEAPDVCKIVSKDGKTETPYKSFNAALLAVKTDETIVLLDDCEATANYYLGYGADYPSYAGSYNASYGFTVDLNGYTLDASKSSFYPYSYDFAYLTFTNSDTNNEAVLNLAGYAINMSSDMCADSYYGDAPFELKFENITVNENADYAIYLGTKYSFNGDRQTLLTLNNAKLIAADNVRYPNYFRYGVEVNCVDGSENSITLEDETGLCLFINSGYYNDPIQITGGGDLEISGGAYGVYSYGGIEITGTGKVDIHDVTYGLENWGYDGHPDIITNSNPNLFVDADGAPIYCAYAAYGNVSAGYYSADVTDFCADGYVCVANTNEETKADYPHTVKPLEIKVNPESIAASEKKTTDGQDLPDGAETKANEAITEMMENTAVGTFVETNIDAATKEKIVENVDDTSFDISMVLDAVKEAAKDPEKNLAQKGQEHPEAVDSNAAASGNGQITISEEQITDEKIDKKINVDLEASKIEVTLDTTDPSTVSTTTVNGATFDVKPTATITITSSTGEILSTVTAVIPNDAITAPITFRLPVDPQIGANLKVTSVWHSDNKNNFKQDYLGIFPIQCDDKGTDDTTDDEFFIELSANKFSYYTYENMMNITESHKVVIRDVNDDYTGFATLKDAIAAFNGTEEGKVESAKAIILLDDIELNKNGEPQGTFDFAGKTIELDLNGHTFKADPAVGKGVKNATGVTVRNTVAVGESVATLAATGVYANNVKDFVMNGYDTKTNTATATPAIAQGTTFNEVFKIVDVPDTRYSGDTIVIGGNRNKDAKADTAKEENPDTGAPVLSMSTGIAVLFGAAFVLSKKK